MNEQGIAGDFLEAGVALGGAGIVLASQMGPNRRFHGYDVFGMIPAPGERDDLKSHERYTVIAAGRSDGLAGEKYYGYLRDLNERVAANFSDFGLAVGDRVHLHQGLFEDTLHPPGPIALAHVDCDWFEAVRTCFERLSPNIGVGGVIVVDDYHDYGGCRQAVDEFLAAAPEFQLEDSGSNVVVRRVG